jgi:hypothetical protein
MKRINVKLCHGCLFFVVHNEISQAVIAALHEKVEEDHGEESASITLARCLKNSEKIKKIVEL